MADALGERAERHGPLLLHGARLGAGSERRSAPILLHGRDAADRLFQSEAGQSFG